MNNIAIFAHYDKDNIIDDYVIYYLNELKKICEKIIFVSDCNLPDIELAKLNKIADFSFAKKHGEYDFGSYKRGYNIAKENNLLLNADNLVFANDSCYGPFQPLDKIFAEMDRQDIDFWGLTSYENRYFKTFIPCKESNNRHVQSYFVVLKNNVFTSEVFDKFINSVKQEKSKEDIILKYEIGLTNTLCKAGFKYNAYTNTPILNINQKNFREKKAAEMFVLIKLEFLKRLYFLSFLKFLSSKTEKSSTYPIKVLKSHLKRTRKIQDFSLREARESLIRIRLKDCSVCINGKWYNFKHKEEVV